MNSIADLAFAPWVIFALALPLLAIYEVLFLLMIIAFGIQLPTLWIVWRYK